MMTAGDREHGYCANCGRFYGTAICCPVCVDIEEQVRRLHHRLQLVTISRRVSWMLVGILIGLLILTWS